MTYSVRCQKHHVTCSPVYWRPEGKTFKRIYPLLWCHGAGEGGHLCVPERGFGYLAEEYLTSRFSVGVDLEQMS